MKTAKLALAVVMVAVLPWSSVQGADVLPWEDLAKHLPDKFLDLNRTGDPDGSTMAMGQNSMSRAHSIYLGDDRKVEITYIRFSSAQNPMWLGYFLGMDTAMDTAELSTKPVKIQGFKARVTYHKQDRYCEVVIGMDKSKTAVEVTASTVDSADPVIAACEALPLAELDALKAQ